MTNVDCDFLSPGGDFSFSALAHAHLPNTFCIIAFSRCQIYPKFRLHLCVIEILSMLGRIHGYHANAEAGPMVSRECPDCGLDIFLEHVNISNDQSRHSRGKI
jgi:hypothetical protein